MRNPFSDTGIDITPIEFEIATKKWLESSGSELKNIEVKHDVDLEAHDGTYQIDVLATFEAFGAEFKVIVECKKHKNAIPRSLVQILHDRVRSLGAQKGILFATTGFQSGAIKYATEHGIALVSIVNGDANYETRSAYPAPKPSWIEFPEFMGWSYQENDNGNFSAKAVQFDESFLSFVKEP
ncbi:restriction endonuclease [Thalassotalea euphylliae]|uniref:Restriction endonuclease n=1 Tax=Thalassotalea euphylliae TaxID=1655234 RepID=A0A3E0TSV1_9GAMM|nr:restriction endonuclease [Thalassotalea euphylliae]REL27052.1 restriction endonuclease [Thalassotalea euphylliae]